MLSPQLFKTWYSNTWLPDGIDWTDILNSKINYPNPLDILYFIPIALGMMVLRCVFERIFFYPLGQHLGLKTKSEITKPANSHLNLEILMKGRNGSVTSIDISSLSKKTGLSSRTVEMWLRKRKHYQNKVVKLHSFGELGWRSFCYTTSFLSGLYILWDKPWLWDMKKCYEGYPFHDLTEDIWWYYTLVFGFNLSLLISILVYPKDKYFYEMFVHHVVTLALILMSWFSNFVRFGTLVILLHDVADVFLEPAKMCQVTKHSRPKNILFTFFAIAWTITRVVMLPTYLLHSAFVDAEEFPAVISNPVLPVIRLVLLVLFGLQLFWTFFVYKGILKSITTADLADTRDSESSQSSDN